MSSLDVTPFPNEAIELIVGLIMLETSAKIFVRFNDVFEDAEIQQKLDRHRTLKTSDWVSKPQTCFLEDFSFLDANRFFS